MSDIHTTLEDYLRVRRSLGHKLVGAEYLLRRFVAFLDEAGATGVTTELAIAWATLPSGASARYHSQRLSAVRRFAAWLHSIDPSTEIPPDDVLPARPARAVAHLYTEEEIAALMAAARRLRGPMRADTYGTLIGLLVSTGLRIGEAIRLDRDDVCAGPDLLRIVESKFGKSREVPLHPTTMRALGRYGQRRDELCPKPKDPAFFLNATGTRLVYSTVKANFQTLLRLAGLHAHSGRGNPRIHDLRHVFATNTLIDWYRQGANVPALLPLLSTYLGHVDPKSTYWYYSDSGVIPMSVPLRA